MTDPWSVREEINSEILENVNNPQEDNNIKLKSENSLAFEDNFTINTCEISSSLNQSNQLPDSEQYLQTLEKKLKKIKKDPKILKQLIEKREECLRNLLNDNSFIDKDENLELDAPITPSESTVQEIYRHMQPVQPLSVGEIVHIVKYDQLENQESTSTDIEAESKLDGHKTT